MVDSVVRVLVAKLLESIESEGRRLLELSEQFDKLKEELLYMRNFLEDANKVRTKDRSNTFKKVVSDLTELVFDAEYIVEDCQIFFLKQGNGWLSNLMSCCSPKLLKFRHHVTKQLILINRGIANVKQRMTTFAPTIAAFTTSEDGSNQQLRNPVLTDEANMVGLENVLAKVQAWIFEANQPFRVIGIVGMGGIGKTTLAQRICNSDAVKRTFDHIIFVVVSQSCQLEGLLKKLLRKMNVQEESMKEIEVEELLKKAKSMFEDTKYLVVLDDVWGTNEGLWWDSLNSAFPKTNGSRLIVTTRKLEVARSMGATDGHICHLKVLSYDDSWSLFKKVAFAANGGGCPNPELEFFGREIVGRCGGLPLAIKVVAGMMLGKGNLVTEWKRISENLKEELEEKNKDEPVTSSLELSYLELPAYLKPCLLSFSFYPEDYIVNSVDIISLWIGEGFVSGRKGKEAVEIGIEWFQELINRCLLIGASKDLFETYFNSCRIHDLVRDMVMKIARDENFISSDDAGKPFLSVHTRRVSCFKNLEIANIKGKAGKNLLVNSKMRTLLALEIQEKEDLFNIQKVKMCELKWLRVLHLDLSWKLFEEVVFGEDWLNGIGSLRHLVYLWISHCALENLPNSIANLYNLRYLGISGWQNLRMLPLTISKLDNLIVLEVLDCDSLECMPEGIGRLLKLEMLKDFVPPIFSSHKKASRIGQLKNFNQLTRLGIQLKNANQLEEGELNVLSEIQHLRILSIEFRFFDDDEPIANKMNHQLSPLPRLEELRLYQIPGESTLVWLNSTSLPNLRFLNLWGGKLTQMSPEFWGREHGDYWKIEVLALDYLHNFKEKWESLRGAMPLLRTVKVSFCPWFRSFPVNVSSRGYGIWRKEEEEGGSISGISGV